METIKSFYKNKRVLITGGTGYLGRLIEKKLKECSSEVILTTTLKEKENISENVYYVDYKNSENLKSVLEGVNIIFHLAAQTSAYKSEDHPLFDLNSNVVPLINLVSVSRELNLKPALVFASTVTIYGLQDLAKFSESNDSSPTTVYDMNKLIGENYIKFFSKKGYIRGCSLRLANVYGPGLRESSSDRGVINKMVKMAVAGNELSIYGDGNFVRDYVFNEDVALAFLHAGAYAANEKGEIFNVCSGEGKTFRDVIDIITKKVFELKGTKINVNFMEFPKMSLDIEKRNFVGNWQKLKKTSGWTPKVNINEGIEKTIESCL